MAGGQVSTHSRPKAAGLGNQLKTKHQNGRFQHTAARRRLEIISTPECLCTCFNTQPPEGGWFCSIRFILIFDLFQHTAARRRLDNDDRAIIFRILFQHTAARRRLGNAAYSLVPAQLFQHTAARRRLALTTCTNITRVWFQHTAARRRLEKDKSTQIGAHFVSTHSRPKAAGTKTVIQSLTRTGFNTQPPEGGWPWFKLAMHDDEMFQHTAARRRLAAQPICQMMLLMFQHTAARRRLAIHINPRVRFRLVSTHSRPKAAGADSSSQQTFVIVSTHSRPKAAG